MAGRCVTRSSPHAPSRAHWRVFIFTLPFGAARCTSATSRREAGPNPTATSKQTEPTSRHSSSEPSGPSLVCAPYIFPSCVCMCVRIARTMLAPIIRRV